MIIWLTGQSGAGKTTLAKRLQEDWPCIVLDGDQMRDSISLGAGFSKEDRAEHNFRVARLARELSKQTNIVISVIAPIEQVRRQIDGIIPVQWIYVKRTLPEREGHFYEAPIGYPVLDHDNLTIEESFVELKRILDNDSKKVYSLFIGRWQPLHDGHLALFDKVRQEGKNILIGIRDTKLDKLNPYTVKERKQMIAKKVPDAKMVVIPDISEVVYGRGVGWGIREIHLDKDIESISATKIREASKDEEK